MLIRKWDCAMCGSAVLYINNAIRCNCGSVKVAKSEHDVEIRSPDNWRKIE